MASRISTKFMLALAGLLLLLSLLAAQAFNTSTATVSNGWTDAVSQEPGISLVCGEPVNEMCPSGGGG